MKCVDGFYCRLFHVGRNSTDYVIFDTCITSNNDNQSHQNRLKFTKNGGNQLPQRCNKNACSVTVSIDSGQIKEQSRHPSVDESRCCTIKEKLGMSH